MKSGGAVFVLGLAGMLGVAACTLLTDTDGLSGGASVADASSDSGTTSEGGDAASDAPTTDASCADAGVDPDLVGYWPLDETSGTAVRDCSGRGHDGMVVSAPPSGAWGSGRVGGAFMGNGSSGCISLGTPGDLLLESSPFTLAAWVNVNSFATNDNDSRYVIGRALNVGNLGWRLSANQDAKYQWTFVGPNRVDLDSPMNHPVATWTHLAVTFVPGGKSFIYVNGVSANEVASPVAIKPAVTAEVRIGCRSNDELYFDGRLDEVRVYRRVLTAVEIASLAK